MNEHTINLTRSQVKNLIEFLEVNLIPSIREDLEIDNINYVCDMCDVYKKLKAAGVEGLEVPEVDNG